MHIAFTFARRAISPCSCAFSRIEPVSRLLRACLSRYPALQLGEELALLQARHLYGQIAIRTNQQDAAMLRPELMAELLLEIYECCCGERACDGL